MGKWILSIICFSFAAQAFESAPNWFFAGSTYSGHEEITRQALNNIAKKIKDEPGARLFDLDDLKFDLNPEPMGLFGYKSRNMVIHGNFASDFPKQTSVLNLGEFWKNKEFANGENGDNQVIHFLRNYLTPVTLASAFETCIEARKNIKYVTGEALSAWAAGDKTKALFLIGHATHTIQDSFSPAHTKRDSDENNNNLMNICFYGNEMAKKMDMNALKKVLCFHSAPDSRDAVWNIKPDQYKKTLASWSSEASSQCDKSGQYPQTEEAKLSCLNHEARLARVATEKYLFLVFNQLSPQTLVTKSTADFLNSLDTNLFDGASGDAELDKKMAAGILRCEGLSNDRYFGFETPL